MDPERFDALVQSLARPGSRRRFLGGILAGSLGPLGAAAKAERHGNHGPKPAACLAIGKRCSQSAESDRLGKDKGKHAGNGAGKHRPPSCSECCSRFGVAGSDGKARCACKPDGDPCANPAQCCGGVCRAGQCTKCPGDLTACEGNCVDLQRNDAHCGDCVTSCSGGQRCQAGKCVCDETSCPNGCCDERASCLRGTSDAACGDGGAACLACSACTACDGTQCVAADACCGEAAVCQGGQCVGCADGQRCQRGQCVCDPTSCADGCCDGDTCVRVAQQSDARCGTGGQACIGCTGHDTCGGGGAKGVCGCTPATTCPGGQTCGRAGDGCGGSIACAGCPGCCVGATCAGGTDDAACGGSGVPCADCTRAGQVCYKRACCAPDSAATTCAGRCGTVTNNCGQPIDCTAHCDGCCDGDTCNAGTDNGACGSNGDGCVSCSSPHVCHEQACCTPDADATTCQGKCGTVQNNCGQDVDCTKRCAGCCTDDNACEPGTSDAFCGRAGAACTACITDPPCGGHCSAVSHACAYDGSHTSCGEQRCATGTVTLVGACDGNGHCTPGQSFGCDPYTCNATGTACLGACDDDRQCVAGDYCTGQRACEPLQADGKTCDRSGQCQSGNCVGGFCCASAACGPCESCASGVCQGTCSHGQTCCGDVCKTAGGFACSHESDCCAGICSYPPEGTSTICCLPSGSACGGQGDVCCSLKCGTFSGQSVICA